MAVSLFSRLIGCHIADMERKMAIGFVMLMALIALGDAGYLGFQLWRGGAVRADMYAIGMAVSALAGFLVWHRALA